MRHTLAEDLDAAETGVVAVGRIAVVVCQQLDRERACDVAVDVEIGPVASGDVEERARGARGLRAEQRTKVVELDKVVGVVEDAGKDRGSAYVGVCVCVYVLERGRAVAVEQVGDADLVYGREHTEVNLQGARRQLRQGVAAAGHAIVAAGEHEAGRVAGRIGRGRDKVEGLGDPLVDGRFLSSADEK